MASKRAARRRECGTKIKYLLEADAFTARHHLGAVGRRMDVYRCSFCGQFHLGHRPGWVARSIRDKRIQKQKRGAA